MGHALELPALSVAEHTTLWLPKLNVDPDTGEHNVAPALMPTTWSECIKTFAPEANASKNKN